MQMLSLHAERILPKRLIFGLAGQSNMSGRGLISEVPTFQYAGSVDLFSNAWQWVAGAEPVDSATGQVDTVSSDSSAAVGPSMAFADRLAQLRNVDRIGLVPGALGGSSLAAWTRDLSRSTLYGSFIARMLKAAEFGTMAGILWYQGESEASDTTLANSVKSKTEALFANFRADLGIPDLPIIATVLGPNPPSPNALPYWSTVQAQQAAISGSKISVVSAADLLGKSGDEIHLTTASQVALGRRYAQAMQAILTS